MNTINGTGGVNQVNPAAYETVTNVQADQNTGANFSNVLNEALRDQMMQSVIPGISGPGASGVAPGVYMPSATTGMENAMLAVAEQGEMSGAHLMLFMLIMMMQSGDSGSELAPIMQMMAQMLSKTTQPDSDAVDLQSNMLNFSDTDPAIRRMVDIALSQVGTQERNADGTIGSGNYTEYGAWYGMDGQPWCAMFVSWAADRAGLLNTVVPRQASTSRGVSAYMDRGLYAPRSSNYIPREGDAIYFQNSSTGQVKHIGIVVAYDPQAQRVYTVEGNTNNAVRIRHYSISDTRIHGYGRNGGTGFGIIPGSSTSGTGANTL